jgi:hypothetical protein
MALAVSCGSSKGSGTGVYVSSYSTSTNPGAVLSVPIGGTTVTTIAGSQPGVSSIAVDASGIYWTTTPGPATPS